MLQHPKILLKRLEILFKVTCFLLAGYMTKVSFARFLDNRDASSFSYKTFNEKSQHKYPTFSICFEGPDIYQPYAADISMRFDISPKKYLHILEGDNVTVPRFNDNDIVYDIRDVSDNDFRKFSINLYDILQGSTFFAKNPNQTVYYAYGKVTEGMEDGKRIDNVPFHISHQTANLICFSRNSLDEIGLVRKSDWLKFWISNGYLARTISQHSDVQLKIFVHYPGHLLRSFNNPSFESYLYGHEWDKKLDFAISSVTVLKKRQNSEHVCDADLTNVDQKVRDNIVSEVGCVPLYWMEFYPNSSVEICNQSSKMKKANDMITIPSHLKRVLNAFDPPCLDMKTMVTHNKNKYYRADTGLFWIITFDYKDDQYQEVENIRAFGFEAFWSGIGGFVGIFLGYSAMQLPELIYFLSSSLHKFIVMKKVSKESFT